ncbi:TlyA family RNA methyltransferase [Candidatus Saccharibacteria bacterium]|nr:TlyA family RNA methyltransferase [Candidatus Saccharibacteria bacterium]
MSDVTRAGQKLTGALKALRIDFRDKLVLDIGSSTGGFTELALTKGAAKVVAVEKGTKQMRGELAADGRVDLHEKTDIFDFEAVDKPDVILADVSFVSLRKILAYAKGHLADKGTEFLVLFKPQFEVRGSELNKGILKSSRVRRAAMADFEKWLKANGFVVLGKRDSEVAGRFGNVERFYHLVLA